MRTKGEICLEPPTSAEMDLLRGQDKFSHLWICHGVFEWPNEALNRREPKNAEVSSVLTMSNFFLVLSDIGN